MATKKKALADMDVPEKLAMMINAKPEEDERVCELVNSENVAMVGFIASYVGVKVSPVEQHFASIGLIEEFGVEAIAEMLKKSSAKKLYLLVNSPGGGMSSSYKIAKVLRNCFDEIVTFVPHIAASGGTLLAVMGNEIVMGEMSQISPMDVQIPYKGTRVSAATFMRFYYRATSWFETVAPEEAPYPQRALADKLDPFIMEEWDGFMDASIDYVTEILTLAGYDNSEKLARRLVLAYPTHGYVITPDKAKDLGFNVKDPSEYQDVWDIMRYWLSLYMFEQESTHCIRYAIPSGGKNDGQ